MATAFQDCAVRVSSSRRTRISSGKATLYLQSLRDLTDKPEELQHIRAYWSAIDGLKLSPDQRVEALLFLVSVIDHLQSSNKPPVMKISKRAKEFVNENIQQWAVQLMRCDPKLNDGQLLDILEAIRLLNKHPGPLVMGFWKSQASRKSIVWWEDEDREKIHDVSKQLNLRIPGSIKWKFPPLICTYD